MNAIETKERASIAGKQAVFLQLCSLYEKVGYRIQSGLNPAHFHGWTGVSYTSVFKDNARLSTGGGISIQEVYFLECLAQYISFQNIFIVGNAFGWSTFCMAFCWPQASIVALDAGIEGADARRGIDLTNQIAQAHNLKVKCVYGYSPRDVARVVEQDLGASPDFVFIDGLHTNEQMLKDYQACAQASNANTCFLFHDVASFKMQRAFRQISARAPSGTVAKLLWRTTSGMGMLLPPSVSAQTRPVLDAFYESDDDIAALQKKSLILRIVESGHLNIPFNFLMRLIGKG